MPVLSAATALIIGGQQATAAYMGGVKVWPATPTLLLWDDFERPDSDTGVGDPIVGPAPVYSAPTDALDLRTYWGIRDGTAATIIKGGGQHVHWLISQTSYRVACNIVALPNNGGVILSGDQATVGTDYAAWHWLTLFLVADRTELRYRVSNAYQVLATGPAVAAGDTVVAEVTPQLVTIAALGITVPNPVPGGLVGLTEAAVGGAQTPKLRVGSIRVEP
jgi:hypothetical protein